MMYKLIFPSLLSERAFDRTTQEMRSDVEFLSRTGSFSEDVWIVGGCRHLETGSGLSAVIVKLQGFEPHIDTLLRLWRGKYMLRITDARPNTIIPDYDAFYGRRDELARAT
jgi:hypothetical protein